MRELRSERTSVNRERVVIQAKAQGEAVAMDRTGQRMGDGVTKVNGVAVVIGLNVTME